MHTFMHMQMALSLHLQCAALLAPTVPVLSRYWLCSHTEMRNVSCASHTHTPAQKGSTNFMLYPFVI